MKELTEIDAAIQDFAQNTPNGSQEVEKLFLNFLLKRERQAFLEEENIEGNKANGYRLGRVTFNNRCIELKVPRDRLGFYSSVLYFHLKQKDEEKMRLTHELYSRGVSQRDIGEVLQRVYGDRFHPSTISRMASRYKEDVETWRKRRLDTRYPVIYIDAIFVPTRRRGSVDKEAYYTVLGLKEDRTREVLAIECVPVESASGWEQVLASLADRGVQATDLVVADGLTGIQNAVNVVFPKARFQTCMVHVLRNLGACVRPADRKSLMVEAKRCLEPGQRAPDEAFRAWSDFIHRWAHDYSSLRKFAKERYRALFTFYNYHPDVQRMIRTTNWVERLHRHFRKTLRVRGALPNEDAVFFLLGSAALNYGCLERKLAAFAKDTTLFPPDR